MRAFLFPGQGSQSVGMGAALSEASRAARDVFEQAMYGNDRVESNALEVHVHALRRKTSARAIRTVRGLGYLFAGTEEPA
jgi:DNA-binding response OmpR family regulator